MTSLRTTLLALFALLCLPSLSKAQSISTEERFQDLFVSAGYGAAYGAAFGAALLSFQDQPEDNLRFVAIGASIGFITGSLLGSYVIFSPVFASAEDATERTMLQSDQSQRLSISPVMDPHKAFRLTAIASQWTLARF